MAQYGESYNFTDSAELKLTALEMMFKDKVTLWESVERGIEATKPATAKLAYMLENLKAIGFRRKAQATSAKSLGYVNPLDVNGLFDDAQDHEEDYGSYWSDVDALGKGKAKGKGKGPKGGCFTCGGDHYASDCPRGGGGGGKNKGKGRGEEDKGKGKRYSKDGGYTGWYSGGWYQQQLSNLWDQMSNLKGKSKGKTRGDKGKGKGSLDYVEDSSSYEDGDHENCPGHPPNELYEVAVQPARSRNDMRPAKKRANILPDLCNYSNGEEESKEGVQANKLDEDFEQAVKEHA